MITSSIRPALAALALAACRPHTTPDEPAHTDEPAVDTATEPTDCPRDRDGIEEHHPQSLTVVERVQGESRRHYPFETDLSETNPGWKLQEQWSLYFRHDDRSRAEYFAASWGSATELNADEDLRPPTIGGEYEPGTWTQSGHHFIFEGEAGTRLDCDRHVLPGDPTWAFWQEELFCTEPDGTWTRWQPIELELDTGFRPCLADYPVPEIPTRWSAWERRSPEGSVNTWPLREEVAEGAFIRNQDLYLHAGGATGGLAEQEALWRTGIEGWEYLSDADLAITFTSAGEDRWRVEVEDGRGMTCDRADLREWADFYTYETFALECVWDDGSETYWLPLDMAFPDGWGSHDAAGGWWSEPFPPR